MLEFYGYLLTAALLIALIVYAQHVAHGTPAHKRRPLPSSRARRARRLDQLAGFTLSTIACLAIAAGVILGGNRLIYPAPVTLAPMPVLHSGASLAHSIAALR